MVNFSYVYFPVIKKKKTMFVYTHTHTHDQDNISILFKSSPINVNVQIGLKIAASYFPLWYHLFPRIPKYFFQAFTSQSFYLIPSSDDPLPKIKFPSIF